ncbi:MAG: MCP four helix bundle domain-containing protein [Terriglobales bacterium]
MSIVKREYIAMKLGLAFGLLVAILIGIGFLGLSQMDQINANLEGVLGRRWGKLQLAREALVYSSRNSRLTMEVFFLNDKQLIDPLLNQRAENTQKILHWATASSSPKMASPCRLQLEHYLEALSQDSSPNKIIR